ncbi:MAG TPA: hypothetical protein VN920_11660, partial [Pyrinomonadaceae bacterium]|nr:hypothetical protein [Pyrinomonadaceae bacterium]
RKRLMPFLIEHLAESSADENEHESNEAKKKRDQTRALIRSLAKSFQYEGYGAGSGSDRVGSGGSGPSGLRDDPVASTTPSGLPAWGPRSAPGSIPSAKAAFFRELCAAVPKNHFLPELLIKESLVARDQWGPFYQLLIARSSGLTSYDRDYAYTAQLQKSWDAAGAEEALDHETSYNVSEPDSRKIKWQKEYLEYLIQRNNTVEARRVIRAVEFAINHRYARPFWLRLATLRLEIRDGHVASACDALARLAGVQTSAKVTAIKPPSVERLNDAARLLRDESHEKEATILVEAAYAREIALEQYHPAYFAGLSRIAFQRGDSTAGLKWLQSMVGLSKDDTKAETAAGLASLPLIKKHSVEAQGVELPGANNGIAEASALRLGAETAGEFSQFAVAITYRRQLLIISPAEEENRIELIRLLAASKKTAEALENLATLIGDRTTTRSLRWRAVLLAPEISDQKAESWTTLRDRVRALSPNDNEMAIALESLALATSDRTNQGIKLLFEIERKNPNPYLRTLQASLERKIGKEGDALNSYLQALIEGRDCCERHPFGFIEDEPLDQIIDLYLKQNQPRAALKMAERLDTLQFRATTAGGDDEEGRVLGMNEPGAEGGRYQTLRERAEWRQRGARGELIELLSVAAEQTGDLNRAIALEQARLALLIRGADRQAARSRLEQLREAQKQFEHRSKPSLVVDQRLVASG